VTGESAEPSRYQFNRLADEVKDTVIRRHPELAEILKDKPVKPADDASEAEEDQYARDAKAWYGRVMEQYGDKMGDMVELAPIPPEDHTHIDANQEFAMRAHEAGTWTGLPERTVPDEPREQLPQDDLDRAYDWGAAEAQFGGSTPAEAAATEVPSQEGAAEPLPAEPLPVVEQMPEPPDETNEVEGTVHLSDQSRGDRTRSGSDSGIEHRELSPEGQRAEAALQSAESYVEGLNQIFRTERIAVEDLAKRLLEIERETLRMAAGLEGDMPKRIQAFADRVEEQIVDMGRRAANNPLDAYMRNERQNKTGENIDRSPIETAMASLYDYLDGFKNMSDSRVRHLRPRVQEVQKRMGHPQPSADMIGRALSDMQHDLETMSAGLNRDERLLTQLLRETIDEARGSLE
jgi:hypothetical protein